MKNLYTLLVLALVTFSCSESDDFSTAVQSKQPIRSITALDPTKLAKVIFYPGTASQKTWYFYPNGLLRKIVNANGSVAQTFEYDSTGRLSHTQSFEFNYNLTYTYDSTFHVATINGTSLNYNPITNQYGDAASAVLLNADGLFTYEFYTYQDYDDNANLVTYSQEGASAGYNNGNLIFSYEDGNPSSTHNFYDSTINPLSEITIPISRALGVGHFNSLSRKWVIADYLSHNTIGKVTYDSDDPEHEEFEYELNANNLPTKQIMKSYYFSTLEHTSTRILYYYQGDVIP